MQRIIAWDRVVQLLEPHSHLFFSSPEFSLLGAGDGQELVDLHRRHKAHLLILDTRMPGWQATAATLDTRLKPLKGVSA